MIIEMDMYQQIRTYHNEGKSIRWIARTLGISRQTVRKYCEGKTHPDVRKEYHREPNVVTDEILAFILKCLRQDEEEGIPKQQHTAKRIYDRLVAEKGFTGGESTIRKAVSELKEEHSVPAQADIPLEYDPGDAIQIDWGECTAYIDNVKTKLQFFCGRLCYSCDIFVQAFYSQNLESFLEAQQLMFDHFGGVPRRLIFDNAKVAVKEGFGLHARATDGYAAFAAHYAFQTDFCNIASGNEKGLVENLVGYARRNFMVPVPRVRSLGKLNQELIQRCLQYRANHKVKRRTEKVSEAYETECQFLHAIPPYRFDTARTATPRVDDYATVKFDRNSYSVPVRYLQKIVTVKGYANEVHIKYQGELIAMFQRLYGKEKTSYQLEHYIDLIERKPRSVFQAKPVRETVARKLLDWGRLLPGGNKEMVRLLRLCVDYGEEKILSIRDTFSGGVIPTVDMVRSHLHEDAQPSVIEFSQDIGITSTDLTRFDRKCGVM